jgi:hypothetical protein
MNAGDLDLGDRAAVALWLAALFKDVRRITWYADCAISSPPTLPADTLYELVTKTMRDIDEHFLRVKLLLQEGGVQAYQIRFHPAAERSQEPGDEAVAWAVALLGIAEWTGEDPEALLQRIGPRPR